MSVGHERAGAIASAQRLHVAVVRLQDEIATLPLDPDRRRQLTERLDNLALAATAFSELATAITAALDRLALGIALLDHHERVVWTNRCLSDMLTQKDGLTIAAGRLSADGSAAAGALSQLIADARVGTGKDEDPAPPVLAIERRDHRQPLLLAALRLPAPRTDPAPPSDHNPIMVCIADPERPIVLPPRDLEALFGLTRTESQVAALLAAGDRLDHSAEKLGVTIGTARTHLKHMFEKTGTGRQSDLSRLLQTLHARIDVD